MQQFSNKDRSLFKKKHAMYLAYVYATLKQLRRI